MKRSLVGLAAGPSVSEEALRSLNRQLCLPRVSPDSCDTELLLVLTSKRLELRQNGVTGEGPVFTDFVSGRSAHRRRYGGGRGQPLARAIGLKQGRNPQVLDATAGLGRDAFVLASLGCQLVMLERSPIIAALLQNGLERALADELTAPVVRRMQLHCGDAVGYLAELHHSQQPQVIYMDPMYPHRNKRALVKKEMRYFRQLAGEDGDSAVLLSAARLHARQRVVVKRPAGAEWVGGAAPTMAIKSQNTRYDVYVNSGFKN